MYSLPPVVSGPILTYPRVYYEGIGMHAMYCSVVVRGHPGYIPGFK